MTTYINFIPFETLSSILILACWEPRRSDEYVDGIHDHYRRVHSTRLVCKYWSDVIVATPSLWGLVYSDNKDSNTSRFEKSLQLAQERKAPLDIHLLWEYQSNQDVMSKVLDLIVPLIPRWRRLILYANQCPRTLLQKLFLPSGEVAFALEDITFHVDTSFSSEIALISDPFPPNENAIWSISPKLSSLRLQAPGWIHLAKAENLAYFDYMPSTGENPSWKDFASMLRQMSKLEVLKVVLQNVSNHASDTARIFLPALHTLQIASSAGMAPPFFQLIDAPKLSTISLVRLNLFDLVGINDIFREEPTKGALITKLVIHDLDEIDPVIDAYHKLLLLLPRITVLHLGMDSQESPRRCFQHLSTLFGFKKTPLEVKSIALPKLDQLELFDMGWCDGEGEFEDLTSFLQELMLACRPIRHLVFDYCDDFTANHIQTLETLVGDVHIVAGDGQCLENGWDLYPYDGTQQLAESNYCYPDPTYDVGSRSHYGEDEGSSTWDTDSDHSVESGEWSRGDQEVVLFKALASTPTGVAYVVKAGNPNSDGLSIGPPIIHHSELVGKTNEELAQMVVEERQIAYLSYLTIMNSVGVDYVRAGRLWESHQRELAAFKDEL